MAQYNELLIESWGKQIYSGLNLNLCIVGRTRGGKSFLALHIAKRLDPSFTIKNVVWSINDLLKLMNSDALHKGSVVVFDELGASAYSRNWYLETNKQLVRVLQVFGYRGISLIVTSPALAFIDKHVQLMFHYKLSPIKILKEKKKVVVRVTKIKYDNANEKPLFPFPVFSIDNRLVKVRDFVFSSPEPEIEREYVKLSETWKRELVEQAESSITDEPEEVKIDEREIVKKILENPGQYKGKRGGWDSRKIDVSFGLGHHASHRVKAMLELNDYTHAPLEASYKRNTDHSRKTVKRKSVK